MLEFSPESQTATSRSHARGGERPPELQAARDRVFAACKANGVRFLDGGPVETVKQRIDEGVRISGGTEELATVAREYVGRTMPV